LTLHAPLQSEINEEAATCIGDISARGIQNGRNLTLNVVQFPGAGQDVH
jgi:hypothetical protein